MIYRKRDNPFFRKREKHPCRYCGFIADSLSNLETHIFFFHSHVKNLSDIMYKPHV